MKALLVMSTLFMLAFSIVLAVLTAFLEQSHTPNEAEGQTVNQASDFSETVYVYWLCAVFEVLQNPLHAGPHQITYRPAIRSFLVDIMAKPACSSETLLKKLRSPRTYELVDKFLRSKLLGLQADLTNASFHLNYRRNRFQNALNRDWLNGNCCNDATEKKQLVYNESVANYEQLQRCIVLYQQILSCNSYNRICSLSYDSSIMGVVLNLQPKA